MLNLNNAFNHSSIKLGNQDIFYACEYRRVWFSKTIVYVNGYVTYGEKCISIPYGEDMEKLICAVYKLGQAKKDKIDFDEELSLSGNETKISINTNGPENAAFLNAKNSNGIEIFTISDLKCVLKLVCVLRDILPIGAFLKENHLSIASAFTECVKTCTETDKLKITAIKSVNYVAEEILKKDPSLKRYKVRNLLRINKTDLSCIANLYPCVSILKSILNTSKVIENNTVPERSSSQQPSAVSNLTNIQKTNNQQTQNTVPESSSNQQPFTISNLTNVQNVNDQQTQNISVDINSLLQLSNLQPPQGMQVIPPMTLPTFPSTVQKNYMITIEPTPPADYLMQVTK